VGFYYQTPSKLSKVNIHQFSQISREQTSFFDEPLIVGEACGTFWVEAGKEATGMFIQVTKPVSD